MITITDIAVIEPTPIDITKSIPTAAESLESKYVTIEILSEC